MNLNVISGDLLETLNDFLKDPKQRVALNEQNALWANAEAGVPQGSTLGLLLFLTSINDFSDNLSTNVKPSPDNTYHYFFLLFELSFKQSKRMEFSMENEL